MFWVTVIRILVIWSCSVAIGAMVFQISKHRAEWNPKTIDLWYGRMMWCVFGVSAAIEGLIRETPFRYSQILLLGASLATLRGILTPGSWGHTNDKDVLPPSKN